MSHNPEFLQDIMAEMAVLGAMMLGSTVAVSDGLSLVAESDFSRDAHGLIFGAMRDLQAAGTPIDIVTLKDELTSRKALDKIGGLSYLMQLGDIEFTIRNLPHYAAIVKEKSHLRKVIGVLTQYYNAAMSCPDDIPALLADLERDVMAVQPEQPGAGLVAFPEIAQVVFDNIEDRMKNGGGLRGISSGFRSIDRLLCGYRGGNMYTIGARPGIGKTSLILNMIASALKQGLSVALFSQEMTNEEIAERFLSSESEVDSTLVSDGVLSDTELNKLYGSLNPMLNAGGKFYIDDASQATPAYIGAACRRHKVKYGLDLVCIDYIQLMNAGGKKKYSNRNEELTDVSKALKALSKDLDVPIIVLAQLSRDVERRENKRPQPSDLRECGQIEQDSTAVAFIYRASAYEENKDGESVDSFLPDPTEFLVRKNRHGPKGTAHISFIGAFTKFMEIDDRHGEGKF